MGAALELTGRVFGDITVLKKSRSNYHGDIQWDCQCACGMLLTVRGFRLTRNEKTHCGCRFRRELLGKTFGRLTVKKYIGHKASRRYWQCLCACGNEFIAVANELKRGNTSSCGCWQVERARAKSIKHGLSYSPEYQAWAGAKDRCTNSKSQTWDAYGGRGIRMCAEWMDDFMVFYAHVGPRPSDDHSLDRINVNGNYEPGNVRWATRSVQQLNRRPWLEWKRKSA